MSRWPCAAGEAHAPHVISHRLVTRTPCVGGRTDYSDCSTIGKERVWPWRPDSHLTASGIPGAVHVREIGGAPPTLRSARTALCRSHHAKGWVFRGAHQGQEGPPMIASPSTFPSILFLRSKCMPGPAHGPVLASPTAPPTEKSLVSVSDEPIHISVSSALVPDLLASQCTVATILSQLFIVAGSTEIAGLDFAITACGAMALLD